ncbi:MAG: hypothetical protein ACTSQJ_03405 [Promethearchaeota archaeon]
MINKEFRNRGRTFLIIISVLLCEFLFWWISPISFIFGIIVFLIAIYFYRKDLLAEQFPENIYLYLGIFTSIMYALIYGALEYYVFQNPKHILFLFQWFKSPIPYWILLILSHFYIIFFITRNLSFSIVLTIFYCVNEDLSFWIFYGIENRIPIMPPPINWFEAFPTFFPKWFIELGVHIDCWPYVPIIYIIIWVITIPLIILILVFANKKKNIKIII